MDELISSKLCDIRVEWVKHAIDVNATGEWGDDDVTPEDVVEDDVSSMLLEMGFDGTDDTVIETTGPGMSTEESFQETEVDLGVGITIALGHERMLSGVYVKYISSGEMVNETDLAEGQRRLCDVLSICSTSDTSGSVNPDAFQIDPDTGLSFMELFLAENTRDVFQNADLEFAVEIHRTNQQVLIHHYALPSEPRRQKRFKEYQDWSPFTYYSIPYEHYFPDYDQPSTTFSMFRCKVGSGSVAWAMIFGYLDRRSHYRQNVFGSGSQGLYRDGFAGTTGSNSQIAPSSSYGYDSRLQRYIEHLNDVLGTWCILGISSTKRMPRVESFFKSRQSTGSPHVVQKKRHWLSFLKLHRYSDSVESWTRDRLREGWPVIVGTKKSWLGDWHYSVATGYRTQSRRWRRCYWIFWKKRCFGWRTTVSNDMYLHMGSGGYVNGWYPMKSLYSVAAKY